MKHNNLKQTNSNYITQYSGKRLLATYQVKSSSDYWCDTQAYIDSQYEFNELIKAIQYDTMNLVDIQEIK